MKVLVIIVTLFTTSSFALEKEAPCRSDIVNFCGGVNGKKKIAACLRQNAKDLSLTCKAQFAQAKVALKDCRSDMKKICNGARVGRGAMLKCLKDNATKISPACKAHVDRQ